MKTRGFEKISKYKDVEFKMPARQTSRAAGYDFCVPEEVVLEPGKLVLVPTGVKAYMQADEYLGMHIRSSMAVKKSLCLVNNEGIIDADYYNNPQLLISHIFGHIKDAFTGADKSVPGLIESANEGILFLDEIGEISITPPSIISEPTQDVPVIEPNVKIEPITKKVVSDSSLVYNTPASSNDADTRVLKIRKSSTSNNIERVDTKK